MVWGRKWTLILTGSCVLVYSLLVLFFIVTTPDVGLRVQPAHGQAQTSSPGGGLRIRPTPLLNAKGEIPPQAGDRLLRLGDQPIHNFLDFAGQFVWLRNAKPSSGLLHPGADPAELAKTFGLPTLVEVSGGERWVEVEFLRPETQTKHTAFLLVQSLPLGEVVLSFIWFLLQLAFFLLGALVCWNRPFDRSARVLFGLGIVALGAFIAANHWWVLTANLWLIVPCAVCGILLPAVLLHFFLVFPRPKTFWQRFPRLSTFALYLLPCVAVVATLGMIRVISRVHQVGQRENLEQLFALLNGLRYGIYGYFCVALVYGLLSVAALVQSLKQAEKAPERQQLKWMFRGALVAAVFVGLALVLGLSRPTEFLLGGWRVPLFLATVSFLAAFSGAIVRHQWLQADQLVSRDMLYYAASLGLTGIISLMIALSILVPQWFDLSLSIQQALTVAAVLTLSVILLLWLRDLFQQMIDRQFFRDRYRLDKALQKIQRSVSQLGDPKAIAQLFLSSCRDVLGVNRGALYLRNETDASFQLMAFAGVEHLPARLALEAPFLDTLQEQGSLQRVTLGTRGELSTGQALLWELDVDLVHGLESGEEIAGLVLLGKKRHAISFTAEDLTFLNALGQIANVAMYSAQIVDQNISRLNDELQLKLEKIANQQRQIALLQAQLTQSHQPAPRGKSSNGAFQREGCLGSSPTMIQVLDTARKIAASEASVLLRGESGTGKEVLAQVLHNNSPRADKPMIRVHCASLSPSLLESELFGHVKGAFTGAHQDRVGRFETANGGTLFLDEIGDISLETQIKLLRVLQERCFEPVGSVQTLHVDVRLITATHQNLHQLIAEGRFREDLYYRLNVISLMLPALRERREDVMELALAFLARSANRLGKHLTHVEGPALEALERYPWPGNIRELENVMERAVVLADGTSISLHDLPPEVTSFPVSRRTRHLQPRKARNFAQGHEEDSREGPVLLDQPSAPPPPLVVDSSTQETLETSRKVPTENRPRSLAPDPPQHNARPNEEAEREQLQSALDQCQGNKTQAAQLLGIPRSTYFSKLKRHGIG